MSAALLGPLAFALLFVLLGVAGRGQRTACGGGSCAGGNTEAPGGCAGCPHAGTRGDEGETPKHGRSFDDVR